MDSEGPQGLGLRMVERRVRRKGLRPRVAASVIALLWLIAIVIFGVVEFLVDRESFDTVWDGMWWATQTVTTVGYGDVVPQQTAGQVIGAVLMIGGLSLFAVITGVITSMFVTASQEHRGDRDPVIGRLDHLAAEMDALRQEVARLESGDARRGPD
jgi:voltage-gated potassium channel